MAEKVALLTREEPVRLDPVRMVELCGQIGDRAAEEAVCRAMEELAVRLSFTERQYRHGKIDAMRKSARALVSIADHMGMYALSRVAGDVIACAEREDRAALAAVLARLIRLGELSLSAIWDIHERPV